MLQTLPGFLAAYWPYLLGVAAACSLLSYFSGKFFAYLKKGMVLFGILFVLAAGYELISGKNLFSLPSSIDRKLSEDPEKVETGRRYYRSFEERYGSPPPQDR